MQIRYLGREDPLEEEMATHSSILVWGIPWTEEPHGLQSMGSQRVGHDHSDLAPAQRGSVEQMRKDLERIKILRKKTFNFKRIEHCHQKGSHRPFSPICTFTKGKLRPTRGGSRAGSCRAKS